MKTKQISCAIFAIATVATAALMTTGCSKDEEYDMQTYDDEYTLAEPMMTRSAEAEYITSQRRGVCTAILYVKESTPSHDEQDSQNQNGNDNDTEKADSIYNSAFGFLYPDNPGAGQDKSHFSASINYKLTIYSSGRRVIDVETYSCDPGNCNVTDITYKDGEYVVTGTYSDGSPASGRVSSL